jgi:DNA-binding PadR family transcriptional regulator
MASHMKALEKEKYIAVSKSFVDRKPNTKYRVTERGRNVFKKHLDALEELVKQQKK